MNGRRFSVVSGWQPRPESSETMGHRLLTNLEALADVSPYFGDWWLADHRVSIEDMIEQDIDPDVVAKILRESQVPLEEARNRMAEVVEYGVRRDDDGVPEPEGGYGVSAFNYNDTEDPPYGVTLSAHGAGVANPRAGLRYAQLETVDNPDPAIVAYPIFSAVLKSIVAAWDVRYAQAYSKALSGLWKKPNKPFFDLSWMTYLSPELGQKVTPPGDVLVERMGDGGLLLIAAAETFDTNNPKHMAAARSILASLADLNAEMEAEYERLWPKWQPPR
jgi:hypothetical protein